ncbi:MAG: hypothetical protein JO285_03640, partial [Kutzneria sp.]|nr:hypothetical protein [Kutzneria sp.]
MLESPEATTIVSHERSHARARHPLLIFFATCALRSWWWIPGYRRLLRQLSTAAELWADHDTRVAVGAPSVARALHAHLSSELSIAGGSWVGFSDPHIELRQRIAALASPLSVASTCQKYLVRCGVVLAMIVVVVLL